MLRGIKTIVSTSLAAIVLSSCQTTGSGGGTPPQPPTVGPTAVNGVFWQNEPLTIYFSNHGSVSESVATVGMNDLYFANPHALQVQLGYQFGATGFEIQENGVTIPILPARTNTKSRPGLVDSNGRVLRWDWPLPADMVPRGAPPRNKSSYSVELVSTCMGNLNPAGVACNAPGTILLLTISPPTQPANPVHGRVFEYSLIEKGSGSFAGRTETTAIKTIYIQPDQCRIRNLLLQPTAGKVGEVATAAFEATNCRRVTLKAGNDVLYDRVSPLFADDVMDSRSFALPRELTLTATVSAVDAMLEGPSSRSERIQIDPCSISATHSRCPVDCAANPTHARCPANCTATPNDPRCATPCPRTTDNPNGEFKTWNTGMYCGTFQTLPVTISGCTFESAKTTFPPNAGCVYTTITGTPVGTPAGCPGNTPKTSYDMCLSCKTSPQDTNPLLEYAVGRDVCSFEQAKQSAIESLRPKICTFVNPGTC